tara:strand:- start:472 stop:1500 length:1029 start_codon:yes stop_codon:yes gene_type:complete
MNLVLTEKFNTKNRILIIENAFKNKHNSISIKTINAIRQILQIERIKNIEEYFENIVNSLHNKKVYWDEFLPEFRIREYNQYLKKEIKGSEDYLTEYFFNTFPKRLSLFRLMHPIDSNSIPIYKHSSITGRLSIEKGINYLVMKKETRKQLRSPLNNHTLFELDFKSCEPNIYAKYFNYIDNSSKDIYIYLAEKLDLQIKDRNQLKRVILSILYGANERSVSKISGISLSSIRKIKKILNIDMFEKSLADEYEKNGFIENLYGRPILSNANLVNYWIQSSAVDFCCLSFLKFFTENKDFKLHAVIHDAVIFSVPNHKIQDLKLINSLTDGQLSIPVEIKQVA